MTVDSKFTWSEHDDAAAQVFFRQERSKQAVKNLEEAMEKMDAQSQKAERINDRSDGLFAQYNDFLKRIKAANAALNPPSP